MNKALLATTHGTSVLFSTSPLEATGSGGATPGNTITAHYYNGNTYFGFINDSGQIRVASYNHTTGAVVTSPALTTTSPTDGHASPTLLVRSSDHKILVVQCNHDGSAMNRWVSTNAEDVSAFGAASDINGSLGGTDLTYANLFQLSGESGKIYLFYRDIQSGTTSVLCYSTSTDGGVTWAAQTAVAKIAASENIYWAINSDGNARIDFAISDGSVAAGDTNASAYHFYYTSGAFKKTDGTALTLPFNPNTATKIYDGATNGGVRAPYSISSDGTAVALATGSPSGWSGNHENYFYSYYNGSAWATHLIDDSGRNPNTSTGFFEGAVVISATNKNVVFVGKAVSGTDEMWQHTTADNGATWSPAQITHGSAHANYHPSSPRNAGAGLEALWACGDVAANFVISNTSIRALL